MITHYLREMISLWGFYFKFKREGKANFCDYSELFSSADDNLLLSLKKNSMNEILPPEGKNSSVCIFLVEISLENSY